ncbi:STAS domain-containing protein [Streptomyces sp. NPDC013455]|uniref:STAS domain-containing protein n=1 Tax=Streptomyces sp. NPDC013455 TaxID=3155605 RepID=UPI0033D28596
MSDFTVITRQYADRTVITVSGEMDLLTCPQLAQASTVIPLNGKTLYLDLSDVPFMDSSGLNLLVLLRRRLHAEGGLLAITGLQPQPAQLLKLTGAYELFAADTVTAAGSEEALTA